MRRLHEFRGRLGARGLRRINQHLLTPIVSTYAWQPGSGGLVAETDLPAARVGLKKAPAKTPPPQGAVGH